MTGSLVSGLVLAAIALAALSGVPGLFFPRGAAAGQRIATALTLVAAALGLAGAGLGLTGLRADIREPWPVPGVELAISVDGLSAVFLVPIFLLSGLGAVYGEGYWAERDHPQSGRRLRLLYGLVTAAIAGIFVARNAFVFLVAWEVMALGAFLLVVTEDDKADAREAGWIYIVATHVGTLALFALFALLHAASGSFAIGPLAPGVAASPMGRAIFLLAILGFGIKAGIMPFHVWLPPAHAATPSHVSALMSGVLIKTGIYGLARVTSLFPDPPLWWGGLLLALGVGSGILGVAFALGQHDLKRLLAYHSIENIGIIVMGLGLGLAGRSLARPEWVVLGLGAALLHVQNHALFKSLLFYGAGSVIHATGTREMDHLGGLAKLMPRTAAGFLVGAAAICALPPLNGFVSEWLLYLGLFHTMESGPRPPWFWGGLALPGLALIGALALACFVKAYGAVFLGVPRTAHAAHAHESPRSVTTPMAIGALLCLAIGLAPIAVAGPLDRAVFAAAPELAGALSIRSLAPLAHLSALGGGLLVIVFVVAATVRARRPAEEPARPGTWDCGYAAPSATMQYTSSSFATWPVAFFRWALLPKTHAPHLTALFPGEARFESHVPDTVLERALVPGMRAAQRLFARARILQQGRVQVYLLYIVVTLLVLLSRV